VAERVNPSKSEFFSVMACLKIGVTEFSHLLVIDERWEQMSIHPLRGNMHINQEPPSGGTSPGTLEGGINVILPMAAT
jgi:hypothetical protein